MSPAQPLQSPGHRLQPIAMCTDISGGWEFVEGPRHDEPVGGGWHRLGEPPVSYAEAVAAHPPQVPHCGIEMTELLPKARRVPGPREACSPSSGDTYLATADGAAVEVEVEATAAKAECPAECTSKGGRAVEAIYYHAFRGTAAQTVDAPGSSLAMEAGAAPPLSTGRGPVALAPPPSSPIKGPTPSVCLYLGKAEGFDYPHPSWDRPRSSPTKRRAAYAQRSSSWMYARRNVWHLREVKRMNRILKVEQQRALQASHAGLPTPPKDPRKKLPWETKSQWKKRRGEERSTRKRDIENAKLLQKARKQGRKKALHRGPKVKKRLGSNAPRLFGK